MVVPDLRLLSTWKKLQAVCGSGESGALTRATLGDPGCSYHYHSIIYLPIHKISTWEGADFHKPLLVDGRGLYASCTNNILWIIIIHCGNPMESLFTCYMRSKDVLSAGGNAGNDDVTTQATSTFHFFCIDGAGALIAPWSHFRSVFPCPWNCPWYPLVNCLMTRFPISSARHSGFSRLEPPDGRLHPVSGCFWMGQLGRQIPWIPWQVGAFRSLFDLL